MDIVRLSQPAPQDLPMLVLAGAYLGRAIHTLLGGRPVYPSLYVVLVGDGAQAALHAAEALFEPCLLDPMPRRVESGIVSAISLVHLVRGPLRRPEPVRRRTRSGAVDTYAPAGCAETVVDPGVEDPRVVLVDRNLAARLTHRTAAAQSLGAALMAAWFGDALAVPLPYRDGGRLEAPDAHVAALLVCTPDVYCDLPQDFRELCLLQEVTVGMARFGPGAEPHHIAVAELAKALLSPPASPVPVDEPAAHLLQAAAGEMRGDKEVALLHLAKLALVCAVLDQSTTISSRHAEPAIVRFRASMVTRERLLVGGCPSRPALRIYELLRAHPGGLPRSEINRLLCGKRSSADITSALEELGLRGWARSERRATGGRSAAWWAAVGGRA